MSNVFSKRMMVGVVMGSFLLGTAGGFGSSFLMMKINENGNGASQIDGDYIEESFMIDAQGKVAPAVVSIVEFRDISAWQQQQGSPFGPNPFGGSPNGTEGPNLTEVAGGTGFIIDPSGIVVSNKHVTSDGKGIYKAYLNDGTEFDLTIEAIDPGNDFVILQLVASEEATEDVKAMVGNFSYADLGDSSTLQVGQQVMAIGNALAEYENTTTAGIVSATGRKVVASDGFGQTSTLYGLIQTDAAINPGNSGGPLVNLAGEVIGINTAVDSSAQGIGFAIPINDVKSAIESWRETGEILRPILGVRYVMLVPARARALDLSMDHGALIIKDPDTKVSPIVAGGPAEKAGLKEWDVILSVEGEALSLDYPLQDAVLRYQVGDKIKMEVWRDGETFEVEVELTRAPASD
ncbi:MAG: trypsin-like peptidase domain-containing protein [Candidatus Gracilibacteria bacterium]